MKLEFGAVLLTGGLSSRMGQAKALLPWGNTSVLNHLAEIIRLSGIPHLSIVTGAHHESILAKHQKMEAQICFNPNWQRGMGTSIQVGVRRLTNQFPNLDGILIMLIDQPLITVAYLKEMIAQFNTNNRSLIASRFENHLGAPALFSAFFFDNLLNLPEHHGAKFIIRATSPDIVFGCDAQRVGYDMDTPDAYEKLRKLYEHEITS